MDTHIQDTILGIGYAYGLPGRVRSATLRTYVLECKRVSWICNNKQHAVAGTKRNVVVVHARVRLNPWKRESPMRVRCPTPQQAATMTTHEAATAATTVKTVLY